MFHLTKWFYEFDSINESVAELFLLFLKIIPRKLYVLHFLWMFVYFIRMNALFFKFKR